MKFYIVVGLLFVFGISDASAQFRKRNTIKKQWPNAEGRAIRNIVRCLQGRDTAAYYSLFPPFDTLWHMVLHNSDNTPETQQELSNLREHPQTLIEFDPLYNTNIIAGFCRVLAKGEDSGVVWRNMVMARYELKIAEPTKSLIGFDKIAPERFNGYLFVNDPFNRNTFCISLKEIQKVRGAFFGGQMINILPAKNVEDFHKREQAEQAYFAWLAEHPESATVDTAKVDSVALAEAAEVDDPLMLVRSEDDLDDDDPSRLEVVDRKYYEGLMDNEIPIRMYIRIMKAIPGKPRQYDGLYKLGDNRKYIRLEIVRGKDDKWIIEDEQAMGTMELVLTGNTYKGPWINANDNGFDVVITQTSLPKGKMEVFDRILDRGASGRVDESDFEPGAQESGKKSKDREDNDDEKADNKKNHKSNKASRTARKKEKAERRAAKRKRRSATDSSE